MQPSLPTAAKELRALRAALGFEAPAAVLLSLAPDLAPLSGRRPFHSQASVAALVAAVPKCLGELTRGKQERAPNHPLKVRARVKKLLVASCS